MTLDLESYAERAERFVSALDREYYLHFAGHKPKFEIEQIYDRHADLFHTSVVDELKERLRAAASDEQRRRLRYLLQLAVEGLIGQATKAQSAALAEREGALRVRLNGESYSYRQAAIVEANEPDQARRAAIERASLDLLASELNPLHVEIVERTHELSSVLGWSSYREMYEELKAIDLGALERQASAFNEATATLYRERVERELVAEIGVGFSDLLRSDLPYFLRATRYDGLFPPDRLVKTFERTLAGLGIDLCRQPNVTLDLEQRPSKSPRAFCASVHVPHEVYLVIPRKGGRDDYAALFHEGGHAEHYASVDPGLPFEFRHLGDNSVTEGFAFLFEHLVEDPAWLRLFLGEEDGARYLEYVRASKLILLRRYAAKLSYELELRGGRRQLSEMPSLYAGLLGDALEIDWPVMSYLSDVDEGFYVANYLRAWAFESRLRQLLRDRFGDAWFSCREAGDLLRSLWRQGQRLGADELLAGLAGADLDFELLVAEVGGPR